MEFSYAVAVMHKTGGWEKKREDENQIGVRFGACTWMYSNAELSPWPEDMNNFIHTLHSVTVAIEKAWEVLFGAHGVVTTGLHGSPRRRNLEVAAIRH